MTEKRENKSISSCLSVPFLDTEPCREPRTEALDLGNCMG